MFEDNFFFYFMMWILIVLVFKVFKYLEFFGCIVKRFIFNLNINDVNFLSFFYYYCY